jgi:uncharacterized lipoprotein YmbA
MPILRRGLLALPSALAACSVLPNRPYQEVQRYALAPERPRREPPSKRGPVLLLRSVRAAPGMDARGLRIVGAGGQVDAQFYNEWSAPPVELVEEALRQWLAGSGLFAAVDLADRTLRDSVVVDLFEHEHVVALPCGERSIRFRPALVVTADELDEAVEALERSVTRVSA